MMAPAQQQVAPNVRRNDPQDYWTSEDTPDTLPVSPTELKSWLEDPAHGFRLPPYLVKSWGPTLVEVAGRLGVIRRARSARTTSGEHLQRALGTHRQAREHLKAIDSEAGKKLLGSLDKQIATLEGLITRNERVVQTLTDTENCLRRTRHVVAGYYRTFRARAEAAGALKPPTIMPEEEAAIRKALEQLHQEYFVNLAEPAKRGLPDCLNAASRQLGIAVAAPGPGLTWGDAFPAALVVGESHAAGAMSPFLDGNFLLVNSAGANYFGAKVFTGTKFSWGAALAGSIVGTAGTSGRAELGVGVGFKVPVPAFGGFDALLFANVRGEVLDLGEGTSLADVQQGNYRVSVNGGICASLSDLGINGAEYFGDPSVKAAAFGLDLLNRATVNGDVWVGAAWRGELELRNHQPVAVTVDGHRFTWDEFMETQQKNLIEQVELANERARRANETRNDLPFLYGP